jgi:hypothetical protein
MNIQKMVYMLLFSAFFSGGAVMAQTPRPTGRTPTLYGGERINPGSMVMGFTTGYPKTSFDLYWGVSQKFDVGLQTGFTYNVRLGGNRQWLGLDVHVPLRWTLLQRAKVAGGLRVAPYFMIGDGSPSISFGADVAFLIDIALPKVFKIIVGPELRTGFATLVGTGIVGYDGGVWANLGLETFLARKFFLGIVFNGGGVWGTGGLWGEGVFRANIFFGGII